MCLKITKLWSCILKNGASNDFCVFRNSCECRKFQSAVKNHGWRLTIGFDTSNDEIVLYFILLYCIVLYFYLVQISYIWQIKNALTWKSLNSAWSILIKIKLILCIDLLVWMKIGFTITPESKQQSKQCTETGCSAPKKTRSFDCVQL
jgi:hypothetical protein